jgi:hypothetical protein
MKSHVEEDEGWLESFWNVWQCSGGSALICVVTWPCPGPGRKRCDYAPVVLAWPLWAGVEIRSKILEGRRDTRPLPAGRSRVLRAILWSRPRTGVSCGE